MNRRSFFATIAAAFGIKLAPGASLPEYPHTSRTGFSDNPAPGGPEDGWRIARIGYRDHFLTYDKDGRLLAIWTVFLYHPELKVFWQLRISPHRFKELVDKFGPSIRVKA